MSELTKVSGREHYRAAKRAQEGLDPLGRSLAVHSGEGDLHDAISTLSRLVQMEQAYVLAAAAMLGRPLAEAAAALDQARLTATIIRMNEQGLGLEDAMILTGGRWQNELQKFSALNKKNGQNREILEAVNAIIKDTKLPTY